jgi:hypothetical protein
MRYAGVLPQRWTAFKRSITSVRLRRKEREAFHKESLHTYPGRACRVTPAPKMPTQSLLSSDLACFFWHAEDVWTPPGAR